MQIMAVPFMEFSKEGYKIKNVFGNKYQKTQRKLLNFMNWCIWEVSKRVPKFDSQSKFCM